MSDTASLSSASGSTTTDDIVVMDDVSLPTDPELQAVMDRFDTSVTLDPDVDILVTDEDSLASSYVDNDSESIGATSSNSVSLSENSVTPVNDNTEQQFYFGTDAIKPPPGSDVAEQDMDGTKSKTRNGSKDSSRGKEVKTKRSVLGMLKKLTKFDKPKKHYPSEFAQIRIDRLPQVFVVKYLGKKEISGLYGLHHVRKPIDEMMAKVKKQLEAKDKLELPLVYMVVSPKGIDIREHKLNKIEGAAPYGTVSIDFISYGVQDIKYWRIFTYIVVKELSSRTKETELHAVLCDSSLNARRLALSLGGAFRLYSKNLTKSGKSHNFQVELRPPDELADSIVKGSECDA